MTTDTIIQTAQMFFNEDHWELHLGSHVNELELPSDAGVEQLAEAVEQQVLPYSHWLGVSANVRVHRDGIDRGTIKIRYGEIVNWRAS